MSFEVGRPGTSDSLELETAVEGGNTRYYRDDSGNFFSLPRADSCSTMPIEDSDDLMRFQVARWNNRLNLEQEGINAKLAEPVCIEYEGRPYMALMGPERGWPVGQDILNVVGPGSTQVDVFDPVKGGDPCREIDVLEFLENGEGRSFRQMEEDGDLVYNGPLTPDDVAYGSRGYVVMDLGEVPGTLPERNAYDTHEELWKGMGVDKRVEELKDEWNISRTEYADDDPLLNGI